MKLEMERGHPVKENVDKLATEPPEIRLVGKGQFAYLWVGTKSGRCFALLSGRRPLLKLAEAIKDTFAE